MSSDNDQSDKIQSEDLERVRAALNTLSEHFDTVHIFTTRLEAATLDGTITLQMGTGNWYSRYGQITEWIIRENESARFKQRKFHQEENH